MPLVVTCFRVLLGYRESHPLPRSLSLLPSLPPSPSFPPPFSLCLSLCLSLSLSRRLHLWRLDPHSELPVKSGATTTEASSLVDLSYWSNPLVSLPLLPYFTHLLYRLPSAVRLATVGMGVVQSMEPREERKTKPERKKLTNLFYPKEEALTLQEEWKGKHWGLRWGRSRSEEKGKAFMMSPRRRKIGQSMSL